MSAEGLHVHGRPHVHGRHLLGGGQLRMQHRRLHLGAQRRVVHPVRRGGLGHPGTTVRRPDRGRRGAGPSEDPARARRRARARRPVPSPEVLLGRSGPARHRVPAHAEVDVGLRRSRYGSAGGVEHPVLLMSAPLGCVGVHHEAVHHHAAGVRRMVLKPGVERCHGLLLRTHVAARAQDVAYPVRAGRRGVRRAHGPLLRRGPRRGRVSEDLVSQPQQHHACPVLRHTILAAAVHDVRILVFLALPRPLLLRERLLGHRLPSDPWLAALHPDAGAGIRPRQREGPRRGVELVESTAPLAQRAVELPLRDAGTRVGRRRLRRLPLLRRDVHDVAPVLRPSLANHDLPHTSSLTTRPCRIVVIQMLVISKVEIARR
mmetsp:Transcript_21402/g.63869  ORF Transcript_21402/g.63869 Transcript_21402/m.63869 type:complete len:374 (+) Transcript_21402:219-1340(+)